MNLSNLLVLWLQSSFVIALALAACLATKRSAPLRLAITRVALLASVCVFLLAPWLTRRESPVVPIQWSVISLPTQAHEKTQLVKPIPAAVKESESAPVSSEVTSSTIPTSSMPVSRIPWIAGVWAIGTTLFATNLGLGFGVLRRMRRDSQPVTDPNTRGVLESVAKGVVSKVPLLLESDSVSTPFVAGVLEPAIFLPTNWAASAEPETLHAVLAHEVAHIANGDLRWNVFYRTVCVLLWPQPLLWMLKRPMVAASEELCDQHVVLNGVAVEKYAACLLALRDTLRPRPAPALGIGAFSTKSLLGKRIEALLDVRRRRGVKISRTASALTRLGAIGLVACASYLFASPTSAQGDDSLAGWAIKPYDAKIRIFDQAGKPAQGNYEAYLVMQGDARAPKVVDLKMQDGSAIVEAKSLGESNTGTLFVKAPSGSVDFVKLWPASALIKEIRMRTPVTIKGRLILPDGGPAAGLTMRVGLLVRRLEGAPTFANLAYTDGSHSIYATTDAQGRYEFSDLPADTTLQLIVVDPRFAMLTMVQRPTTPKSGDLKYDIQLEPGAYITGHVTRDGKPASGILVGAQENYMKGGDNRGDWAEAVTDANGRYALWGLGSATYNIALLLDGKVAEEVNAPAHEGIVAKPNQTIDGIDFELKPGAVIQGHVYDKAGKPFGYTQVGVYGPAHPDSSAWVQCFKTDSQGFYKARVPAGKQKVYWMGGQGGKPEYITVADGAKVEYDIWLDGDAKYSERTPTSKKVSETSPSETASFGPGGPAYGPFKLKNGVTAKLAFVQEASNEPHSIWNPDGKSASPADTARSLDMTGFGSGQDSERIIFLRIDIEGANRGDYYCLGEVPHKSDRTVWQTYGESNSDRSLDLASFRAPSNLTQTDFRFGIAAGKKKPYLSWTAGQASGALHILPSKKGPADPQFSVTLDVPPSLDQALVDVDVFDKSGRELDDIIISAESEIDPSTGKRTRHFPFGGVPASQVGRIEVYVRNFEWVTFRESISSPADSNREAER